MWNAISYRRSLRTATPSVIHLPECSIGEPIAHREPAEPKAQIKRRFAVLLAVIAVPAMAAPGDFGAMPGDASQGSVAEFGSAEAIEQLAFEAGGANFPGSAFYFLEDPPAASLIALPNADPLDLDIGANDYGDLIDVGPAASPFSGKLGGSDHSRAFKCLTQAVYYEAASESEAGQRAVAQVVLNRVSHPSWPGNVCGVVYQGSNRSTGCQFTFTCDGSLAREPGRNSWAQAQLVAAEALDGKVYAPVGHATHYHTHWVNPYWAKSLDHIGTIGAHRFYKNRGAGGAKSAFRMAYQGGEMNVFSRSAIRASQATTTPAPAQTSRQTNRYATAQTEQPVSDSDTPEISVPVDPAMQNAGQVKQSFSNAGQWKGDAEDVLAAREAARQNRESISE